MYHYTSNFIEISRIENEQFVQLSTGDQICFTTSDVFNSFYILDIEMSLLIPTTNGFMILQPSYTYGSLQHV